MFKHTFTDPQGTFHEEALFCVSSVSCSSNTNKNYRFDNKTKIGNETENYNSHMSYTVNYWASQESYDKGLPCYELISNDETSEVSFFVDSPDFSSGLTCEGIAEVNLKELILNISED